MDHEATPTLSLLVLTCLILLGTSLFHLIFVLPVISAMMGSFGASYSAPTRIAFALAEYGLPLGILGGAVFGLYVWYRKEPGRRQRLGLALGATSTLLAIYLFLLTWAYLDFASSVPSHRPEPTLATPPPAPLPGR